MQPIVVICIQLWVIVLALPNSGLRSVQREPIFPLFERSPALPPGKQLCVRFDGTSLQLWMLFKGLHLQRAMMDEPNGSCNLKKETKNRRRLVTTGYDGAKYCIKCCWRHPTQPPNKACLSHFEKCLHNHLRFSVYLEFSYMVSLLYLHTSSMLFGRVEWVTLEAAGSFFYLITQYSDLSMFSSTLQLVKQFISM